MEMFFNITGSGNDLIGSSANVFPNSNLGTYVQNSGNLIFKGAELKTFKGISSNVCGVNINYRVYEISATPGVFTTLTLPFFEDCVSGSFPTGGTCDAGDQKWQDVSSMLDLTTLATGNYRIEVYFEVTGDYDSLIDCNDTILVDNNGSYYTATFSIQSTPTFTYVEPGFCNATNGSITISGFNPSDQYSVTYTDDGIVVGPTNYYANLSGQIILNGLNAGVYSNFNFSINGCNLSSTNTITLVNPVITPTFNQIGPFCAGTTFSLPITSNEGITGSWTPALNNTQTTVYTFVPNANQCAVNSNPYTVIINPLPFITQIAPVDFCPGANASFTIEGSANATVSYQINSGATQTVVLGANGIATITVNNPTANVVLTLSLINDGTCTNTLNSTATANLLPLPNVSSLVATNPIVCLGSDASFTITGTPNATVTYTINTGANQTLTLNASGTFTLVVSSPVTDIQVVLVDITNSLTTCSRVLTGISATATIVTVPIPTATVTQPTCVDPSATIEVTSPLINQLNYPSDLFISEVTDAQPGSLTYVEIYNGTGATVNLSNYKLKVYTNGNPTAVCDLPLSGTLINDDVVVIKLSSSANEGGVVPDLSFTTCSGVNNNDKIAIATSSDVELDVWGTSDGSLFTPAFGVGYNYQRIATGTVLPSITWNPADWMAVDWGNPTATNGDYSNVGVYSLFVSNYEYILSNTTTTQTQTTATYTGVVPGSYTLVAHDMVNNCFSLPLNLTINPPVFANPVTSFSYTTPVCQDSANLLPDTSATGFTTGGLFTSTTGLVINATSGEIDVLNSTIGNYVITYTVASNVSNCLNGGSSTFTIVIQSFTPATFTSISLCEDATMASLPLNSVEGFSGQWTLAGNPVTMIDTNVLPGNYQYIFTPDPGQCASAGTLVVTIDARDTTSFNPLKSLYRFK
ncbi:MAG: lamin tail domain-containing protein [Flavobacterium sp.]|nr:lamin tail domain-containing protein [Flavobacterium sp.]